MSKHSHPGGGQGHPGPDQTRPVDNQFKVTGSIHVRGEVETRLAPDLEEKRRTAEEKKERRDKNRFMVELLTLCFLIIYALLTGLQAFEAHRANGIANAALKSVQRAFVFVTKFDVVRVVDPTSHQLDGSMRLAFEWENGGDTPTKYMTVNVSSRWLAEPMPRNLYLQEDPSPHGPLKMFAGPKSSTRSQPVLIPAHDIIAIQNHTGHLYLWGWARYRDVFPDSPEHITRFCTEIIDVVGDLSGMNGQPVNIQTASCDDGNCYDEECKVK